MLYAIIYKFTNLLTSEIYIGASELPETRRKHYESFQRSSLVPAVVESIEKYGIDNHRWEIVVEINHAIKAKQLFKMEKNFIRGYEEAGFKLLNIMEHKERKKKRHGYVKTLLQTEEKSKALYDQKRKPIIEIDPNGNVINEWPSFRAFAKAHPWCFLDKYPDRFKYKFNNHKPSPRPFTEKKTVMQYSRNGELIQQFESIGAASHSTGICQGNISNCCNGKLKTAGGYIWKHKNEIDNEK